MLAAMAVGMIATGAVFLSVVGLKIWDQVLLQYPTQALLAMAAGMTIPIVAWMLFRGMGARNSAEMAAAMVLPVIPFLRLVWFDVTKSAWCGPYCVLTIVAMLGLMFYRRSQYSTPEAQQQQPTRPPEPIYDGRAYTIEGWLAEVSGPLSAHSEEVIPAVSVDGRVRDRGGDLLRAVCLRHQHRGRVASLAGSP